MLADPFKEILEMPEYPRFSKPSELRDELARLVLKGSVTNRMQIEQNMVFIERLKPELIRHRFIRTDTKWVGELTRYMGAIERVMNLMGYATKIVRRKRGNRTIKELACTLNKTANIDQVTREMMRLHLIEQIEMYNRKLTQSIIKLKALSTGDAKPKE